MTQQTIGAGRLEQRTSGAKANANFTELYGRNTLVEIVATANNTNFSVPAGYVIESIAFQNTSANDVTGGVKFGTTNGGTEIVTAQAVTAGSLDTILGANISKRVFSTTANTTVYIRAVTSWNAATVNFKIALRKMF